MSSPSHSPGPSFWRATFWSAVVAGSLFLILVIVLPALFGGRVTLGPPRIIGALVINEDPSSVTTGLIVGGVVGHYFLSFVFTLILSLIVYRMGTGAAVATGAIFGIALYLLNFYMMAVAFPWFAEFRNATTFLSHIVFGITAAWVYKRLKAPVKASIRPL